MSILDNSFLYFNRADLFADDHEGSMPHPNIDIRDAQFRDETSIDTKSLSTIYKALRKTSFLNCWHVANHESASMWEQYSQKGVVIKSTVGDLINAVEDESKGVYIGRVEYINYDEDIIRADHPVVPLFYKRREFKQEQELRAVIRNPPLIEANDNDDVDAIFPAKDIVEGNLEPVKRHHLFLEPSTLIKEVRLAPSSRSWRLQLIKSVSEKYGLDPQIVCRSSMETNSRF
ncbi:hypothetical protein ACFQE8_13020 [Salinirubellus sp. GCM10025818]|uniref:hypothetical protein n=1 Tax=Salinirubellus TaxID=2162630 RepID=UPI0030D51830